MVLQIADGIILAPVFRRAIINVISEIDSQELLEVIGRLCLFGLGIFSPLLLVGYGAEYGINPLAGIAVIASLLLAVMSWHWHASLNQENVNPRACI